jgi:hypothetical protein
MLSEGVDLLIWQDSTERSALPVVSTAHSNIGAGCRALCCEDVAGSGFFGEMKKKTTPVRAPSMYESERFVNPDGGETV